jgi:hypothetical protein
MQKVTTNRLIVLLGMIAGHELLVGLVTDQSGMQKAQLSMLKKGKEMAVL